MTRRARIRPAEAGMADGVRCWTGAVLQQQAELEAET
jgi:hypothetical protein